MAEVALSTLCLPVDMGCEALVNQGPSLHRSSIQLMLMLILLLLLLLELEVKRNQGRGAGKLPVTSCTRNSRSRTRGTK